MPVLKIFSFFVICWLTAIDISWFRPGNGCFEILNSFPSGMFHFMN
jgi:hypothetical protein